MIAGSKRILLDGRDGVYASPGLREQLRHSATLGLEDAMDTVCIVHTMWYGKQDGPFSVRIGDDIINLVACRENENIEYRLPEET